MSSFTKSGRSSRMWRKLAKPAPASSTETRTSEPMLRTAARKRRVVLDRDVLGHLEHRRSAGTAQATPQAVALEEEIGRHVEAQPPVARQLVGLGDRGGQAGLLEFEAQADRIGVGEAAIRAGPVVEPGQRLMADRRPWRDRRSAGRPDRMRRTHEDTLRARPGPRRAAAGRGSPAPGAPRRPPRTTRGPAADERGSGIPSADCVQTTIAPSIAVLVRSGMIAIAVGSSPTTRRRVVPKPASQGPTHGPAPTRSAQPAVSSAGSGLLTRTRTSTEMSRARGTAWPAASRATTRTLVRPAIRLSSSQIAWAVASAVPSASRWLRAVACSAHSCSRSARVRAVDLTWSVRSTLRRRSSWWSRRVSSRFRTRSSTSAGSNGLVR